MDKKKDNLKIMKKEELEKELAILREEVRVSNFKSEGSRSKNVKEMREKKRQIARILTEINNKN